MEKDTVVLATYDLLPTARNAIQSLLEAGFERTDIGLAVKEGPGHGALLTVTVNENRVEDAMDVMNAHGAQMCTTREAQWKIAEDDRVPDPEEYTAVELE